MANSFGDVSKQIFTSHSLFCSSNVSLGNFFLSVSMVRPTMYSLQIVISCWAWNMSTCQSNWPPRFLKQRTVFFFSLSFSHLCNFLLVVNYQQWYRQQDGSETFHSFLKPPGRGQLVALLQAGDEVGEAQAYSRQPLLGPAVLKILGVGILTFSKICD